MDVVKVSAKTVEDALTEASIQLGTSSDNIEYTVIDEGTKGFFGIGGRKAVIEARKKVTDEDLMKEIFEDMPEKSVKDSNKEYKKEQKKEYKKEYKQEKKESAEEKKDIKKESKKESGKDLKKEQRKEQKRETAKEQLKESEKSSGKASVKEPVKNVNTESSSESGKETKKDNKREPKKDRRKEYDRKEKERKSNDQSEIDNKESSDVRKEDSVQKIAKAPADPEEAKKLATDFIKEVLLTMGMEVEVKAQFEDDTLCVDIEGEDMGIMIGKRGQTLDSLQYLTSLVVNKGKASYVRVKVDTEDYRNRRKATLENLARNIAFKVKKTRKPVFLEPMNPYERRIIHSALQNDPYVTTHSEGEEPYRKVVVTLRKDRDKGRGYSKYNNRRGRYDRDSAAIETEQSEFVNTDLQTENSEE